MEPTSLIDDAEFSLPSEFLTDDDLLVEKENKFVKSDEYNMCVFPYERIGDEEELLSGLTRKMVQSSLEDDFSGGFCGNDAKAWGATRSTVCGAGGRQNPNCQTRVSSQAAAWDLYCAAAEELAMMNINGYNNHSDRRLLDLPRKHFLTAAKTTNDGSGYYSRQSLQYQKLQAIQQQQLMKHHHHLVQQSRRLSVNHNKIAGSVDLSPSPWFNKSGTRADFLGNRAGKRGAIGTGVFLPRRVTPAAVETREKTSLVRSSPNLNDASWTQRSNNAGFSSQMKMEQPVNDPRLPSEWAY